MPQLPKRTPVCLDGDAVAKRAIMASAADDLKAGIVPSGGVFGYLRTLIAVLRNGRYNAGSITAFFDQGVPQYRRDLIPDYKSERKARRERWTDEEKERIYGQMVAIREVTALLGVNVVHLPGWEADDGLAAFAWRHGPFALMVSGDRDTFQVCRVGCHLLYIKDDTIVTPENFQDVVGVPPPLYVLYKALIGDTSDSIPGVHGCGEKRAVECLNTRGGWDMDPHGQLDELCRRLARTPNRRKWETEILRARARMHKTIDAIDFAKAADHYPDFPAPRQGVVDRAGFIDFCKRWKFASILADTPRIIPLFERD